MDSENYGRLPENLKTQNVTKMAGYVERLQQIDALELAYKE